MCGRYSLTVTKKALQTRFDADGEPDHHPRFNMAPGQIAPAVVARDARRGWADVHWGWRSPGSGRLLINARSEALAQREAFRRWLDGFRCLVPADGFYEWARGEGRTGKQAFRARLADGRLFAMAGLWRPEADGMAGAFVILTTRSSGALAAIHARSPVRLRREDEDAWVDPARSFREVRDLLGRSPAEAYVLDPVAPAVHRADHDAPDCIRRVHLMRSGSLF